MTAPIVSESSGEWQPVRVGPGAVGDLAVGVHPIDGHPELALMVLELPREYVVTTKACRHDNRVSLVEMGSINSATRALACRHPRFKWCLESGSNDAGAPNLPLYPSAIVDNVLYVKLPTGSAA